jgi:hypothetical protein
MSCLLRDYKCPFCDATHQVAIDLRAAGVHIEFLVTCPVEQKTFSLLIASFDGLQHENPPEGAIIARDFE